MGRFGCQEVEKFVHVFVDGEFDEADRREFEIHLSRCQRCRSLATFQARFRQALRAAVPRPKAPPALRERLMREMKRQPVGAGAGAETGSRGSRAWTRPLPMAAAAVAVVALMWSPKRPPAVVSESVQAHRRGLPFEVQGPDLASVRTWFHGKVDFPVRPLRFARARGTLLGARLSNVQSRQAAYLIYNVGGARLSVMMFPAEGLPFDGTRRRQVRGHEVFLDQENGYQVALLRDRGLGYAITGDVDEAEMLRLVETAFSSP
jgi:anti-sigma factor (TIGR02949 family)